mmetsp:Transcript_15986/g.37020  ORF Transcript_15986/g.37020 Transcript_15986/m.37020 type:complete len:940 (+) Transcript_15986:227-3046(+)
MTPSTPFLLSGLAPGDKTSEPKKSLSHLIKLRDTKRETLSRLFEEKKKIIERMKTMNNELMVLDDEIEALEEQRDQTRQLRRITPQLKPPLVQVKSEPVISSGDAHTIQNSRSPLHIPLTMNPDEVLTEPTQTTPTRDHCDDEQLTDPLTWTQVERANDGPLRSGLLVSTDQNRQQSTSTSPEDEDDYFYDSGEDHANGPPVNHGSIIANNNNNYNNNNVNFQRGNSTIIHPLQFENVNKPKPSGSNPQRAAGTIDDFFSPRRQGSNENNQQNTSISTSDGSSCPYSRHDIYQTLRQSFRLNEFRENQFEIIRSTLSGKDNFVLMKTGGGKSLLYQLPAVLESPKVTVVVSPLLSLIQDQEEQMNSFVRNSCVSFTSGMGTSQHNDNWKRVRDVSGGIMMMLVTPERVFKSGKLKSELQNLDAQNRLGRFVIDECHCACQWGHDFRPDYAKLRVLRQHFPHVPILAVTATASEQVRKECVQIFQLSRGHAFFRSTADRPNLTYQVRPKESNVIQDMADFIKSKHPRSAGIVYTYSRKDADTVASELCEQGIIAESYHSDVSPTRKKAIHQSWMRNRTQVVVATIAFGLGINKPDVRFVLHHTLSKTLESYYQESGRAGRDGNQSDCVLYYSPKDVPRMLKMIHGESTEHLFMTMVKYAQQFGDDQACRALILQNMGEPNQNPEKFRGLNAMVELRDVTSHAITLVKLLIHYQNKNVTMNMLINEWRKSPSNAIECVKNNPPGKDLTKEDSERMIVGMIVNGLFEPIYRFTAYSTVVYLQCTPTARRFIVSDKANMRLPLPKPVPKNRKSNANTVSLDKDGWVETNATKLKRISTAKKSRKKTLAKKTVTKKKTNAKKRRPIAKPRSQKAVKKIENEVIELIEDTDESDAENLETCTTTKNVRRRKQTATYAPLIASAASRSTDENYLSDDDSVSEYELN